MLLGQADRGECARTSIAQPTALERFTKRVEQMLQAPAREQVVAASWASWAAAGFLWPWRKGGQYTSRWL